MSARSSAVLAAPMIEYRPCGACRALVPVDDGCSHWKPGNKMGKPARQWRNRPPVRPNPESLRFQAMLERAVARSRAMNYQPPPRIDSQSSDRVE